ncbi:Uncharacterized protein dnm_061490 [Desulfonema magnum]|uniref:Uncharacterized protein n=1 Tax=Desulfonema magnum TaxID=45655 RepID=A0A975GRK5_9BACT|nr:Uncharacterized protein dnm_061490 [Desulfonema magnum]
MQKLYFCTCEKIFFALRRKYRKTRLRLNQQHCPDMGKECDCLY